MSDITRLKEQLHHVALEANQVAGGLGSFQNKFGQSSPSPSPDRRARTGADRQISEVLDAAGRAVGQAIEALQIASAGCANYANQI